MDKGKKQRSNSIITSQPRATSYPRQPSRALNNPQAQHADLKKSLSTALYLTKQPLCLVSLFTTAQHAILTCASQRAQSTLHFPFFHLHSQHTHPQASPNSPS
jgi:hypothetical protein